MSLGAVVDAAAKLRFNAFLLLFLKIGCKNR